MTDLPRLLADRCATCVFRPGNLMHLQPGRLASLVADNLAAGAVLTCHSTLHGQTEDEAMCRGFFDAYGPQTRTVRTMDALFPDGWFVEVPPPGDPDTPDVSGGCDAGLRMPTISP